MDQDVTVGCQDALTTLESLRLSASAAYHSISSAIRMDKVLSLLNRSRISSETPVWLLGQCYAAEGDADQQQIFSSMLHHFHSVIWLTYRSNLAMPLGDAQLRSDAGWGCTLRSGQMILAQALQRHLLGSDWRWPLEPMTAAGGAPADDLPPAGLCEILRLFWDIPALSSPFSLHNLCYHGATCGAFPGRWLGPWGVCQTLQGAAASAEGMRGVRVEVVASAGCGAPWLDTGRFASWFDAGADESQHGHKLGLVLLIPLVLGLGKLNPTYLPQLHAVLAIPQSIGIVGGRPGSSLYFVGCNGDNVLYLDPHQVQDAASSDADWRTFRCDVLRTMALHAIDPSLALGFYCGSSDEYHTLCAKLAELEQAHPAAPLVCVRDGAEPGPEDYDEGEEEWASDELDGSTSRDANGGKELDALDGILRCGGEENATQKPASTGQTGSKAGWELL